MSVMWFCEKRCEPDAYNKLLLNHSERTFEDLKFVNKWSFPGWKRTGESGKIVGLKKFVKKGRTCVVARCTIFLAVDAWSIENR